MFWNDSLILVYTTHSQPFWTNYLPMVFYDRTMKPIKCTKYINFIVALVWHPVGQMTTEVLLANCIISIFVLEFTESEYITPDSSQKSDIFCKVFHACSIRAPVDCRRVGGRKTGSCTQLGYQETSLFCLTVVIVGGRSARREQPAPCKRHARHPLLPPPSGWHRGLCHL